LIGEEVESVQQSEVEITAAPIQKIEKIE